MDHRRDPRPDDRDRDSAAGDAAHDPQRRARLGEVAAALRGLHRHLMDEARHDYEREVGPIASSAALLQLLMGDPFFGWLRLLSGAMAALDELLDQVEPLSSDQARRVGQRFDSLVTGEAEAAEFGARYREYLQRSPDLVMAHAAVRLALRKVG